MLIVDLYFTLKKNNKSNNRCCCHWA